MAQHDYNIANGSGAVVRADINSALDAVVSHNSGASAPSTTFAYMFWADTTTAILKMRNAANTSWISMQNLDGTLIASVVATASIANNAVTYAKIAQGTALSVPGVTGNATANLADIVAANDGEVLRRSGTALAFGTVATAGIANNAVTYAKIAQGTALSVLGVTGNATANLADMVAGTDGHVLRRSGTTLGFGTIATAGIANNAVTDALLRQGAALTIIGRSANSTGNVADIAATATSGAVLRESGSTIGFGTVATAGIAANAITNAKLAQMAVNTIKGRITAGTGDPEDLSAANVKTILALAQADISGLTTASSPQFTAIEVGNASDTTLARGSAGVLTVEGVTIPTISSTNTLTNKRITKRVSSTTSTATLTPDADSYDAYVLSAQAAALNIANHTGTPTDEQQFTVRIKDNATARAITYGTNYRAMGTALPSTTVISKWLKLIFMYNSTDSKWDLVSAAQEA